MRRSALSRKDPWPLLVLLAAAPVAAVVLAPGQMRSWHFFVTGARVLAGSNPLSLYAAHPELQIGPLSFVVAAPLVFALPPPIATWAAAAVMQGTGLMVVREMRLLLAPTTGRERIRWLLVAVLVLVGWDDVAARFGHLDDVLALALAVLSIRLTIAGRPLLGAAVVALAIDAKPWVIPVAAVLLLAPRRQWLPATVIVLAGVAVAWAPFFIADPQSVRTLHYAIGVDRITSLRLFGVRDRLTPPWVRIAQIGGGLILASTAVLRGRWSAVLLIVVALRMLLDPAARTYYDSGLLIGAGVFDLIAVGTLVPVATLVALVLVHLPVLLVNGLVTAGELRSVVRTAALLALLAAGLLLRPRALVGASLARRPLHPPVLRASSPACRARVRRDRRG